MSTLLQPPKRENLFEFVHLQCMTRIPKPFPATSLPASGPHWFMDGDSQRPFRYFCIMAVEGGESGGGGEWDVYLERLQTIV